MFTSMEKVVNEAKKSKKKKQMKQEYKIDLTILGIIMMLGLPIAWALWFGSNIAERGNSPPFSPLWSLYFYDRISHSNNLL